MALLCGGPSPERGISLNSARSVLDHLSSSYVEIHPIYVDVFKNFYSISPSQLYSNTPSDFDFKLSQTACKLSEEELIDALKKADITFPVIHGSFGEGEVLSVEEKFQGGTGVNITPPLEEVISAESRKLIKRRIEKVAQALDIRNYARLDVFFNIHSKILYLIEANSLPGLTPATVLYHQALAENPPLYPKEFLEKLIEMKKNGKEPTKLKRFFSSKANSSNPGFN